MSRRTALAHLFALLCWTCFLFVLGTGTASANCGSVGYGPGQGASSSVSQVGEQCRSTTVKASIVVAAAGGTATVAGTAVALAAGRSAAAEAAEEAAATEELAETVAEGGSRNRPAPAPTARADPELAARDTTAQPECEDPVDPITGDVIVRKTDVTLPGLLSLVVSRAHLSSYRSGGWFGPTWASTLDQRLELDGEGAALTLADGRILLYPLPEPDRPVLPVTGERLPLTWDGRPGGAMRVTDQDSGDVLEFAPPGAAASVPYVLPLRGISDRNGHRVDVDRTPDGAPTAMRHSGGYHLAVETAGGRITALSLAGTVLVRYGYDAAGHLTEVADSSGRPMRWSYDAEGRITGWADRNGTWYRYHYDAQGRCVRTEGSDGVQSGSFAYAPAHRTTVHTDARGHRTTYRYNRAHLVTEVIDPLGGTTRTDWDRQRRMTSRTDPLGRTTAFTYDAEGRPAAVVRPDGHAARTVHDARGLPVQVHAPDGALWQQAHDERGNLVAVTDPAGATTRLTRDAQGRPVALTDPLGATSRIRCDAAGLPVEITDPLGGTTRYERDAFGRVVTATDPVGAVTRFSWTPEGRLLRRTDPDGSEERWTYDAEGNTTAHTDASGATTTWTYGPFDRPVSCTRPDGSRLAVAYDAALRPVQVTDPQGLTWSYGYDPAGRLTTETDFDGRTQRYTFDAAARLTGRTNAAGQSVTYSYDILDNVTEVAGEAGRTSYAYDLGGRLRQASGPDGVIDLAYDACGRVTAETVDGRTLTTVRDAAGRPVGRTTPTGATTAYAYDPAGRVTSLTASGHVLRFGHDAAGRETRRGIGEAVALDQTWDPLGRLTGQTLTGSSGTVQSRGYRYGAGHRLVGIEDSATGPRSFELDPVGRITAVRAGDRTERYAYDAAGNQTDASWPDRRPGQEAAGPRTYQGTRVTSAGRIRYEYDAQGRLVLRRRTRLSHKPDTWRYEWDAEDRLTGVTTPDGTRWRYRYDPLGRRSAKERLDAAGAVVERVDFTWDGPLLVEQTTGRVVLTWDHDGVRPLAQTERITAADAPQQVVDERFFAIVTDLVGTPTELVDETGAVAWRALSTLWGATTWPPGSTAHTPLRFPGQYADPETGLHYNVFRYYDPETARYTSPDPLGLAPSPNPAAYVGNPLAACDPLGLEGCAAAEAPGGLYRRTSNTGPFKGLQVPMQKRVVLKTARAAGVDLSGVRIRINRQAELIGKGLYGHTTSDGRVITFYPDAFTSMEDLVRTIGHERTHVMQAQIYGEAPSTDVERVWERAAYDIEYQFWDYYNGRLG
ncbi:MAG: DUF6531 domain-containing protein [Actinomycetia bacterium]|nr:DUF6531 domain-containing protein [Actinomycetes bacterium]